MSRKITTLLLSSLLGLALIPATGVSANVGNDDSSSTGGGYVELSTGVSNFLCKWKSSPIS
ncbi:hypothetical protein ACFP1L_14630 [Lactiplantibacillus nangangensis]|uniref:Secreted protein n=1 Tax=Lactiplantibacillus nangangensis TaxID=2559917 RepID=A0ABW1SN47_9LACO